MLAIQIVADCSDNRLDYAYGRFISTALVYTLFLKLVFLSHFLRSGVVIDLGTVRDRTIRPRTVRPTDCSFIHSFWRLI